MFKTSNNPRVCVQSVRPRGRSSEEPYAGSPAGLSSVFFLIQTKSAGCSGRAWVRQEESFPQQQPPCALGETRALSVQRSWGNDVMRPALPLQPPLNWRLSLSSLTLLSLPPSFIALLKHFDFIHIIIFVYVFYSVATIHTNRSDFFFFLEKYILIHWTNLLRSYFNSRGYSNTACCLRVFLKRVRWAVEKQNQNKQNKTKKRIVGESIICFGAEIFAALHSLWWSHTVSPRLAQGFIQ